MPLSNIRNLSLRCVVSLVFCLFCCLGTDRTLLLKHAYKKLLWIFYMYYRIDMTTHGFAYDKQVSGCSLGVFSLRLIQCETGINCNQVSTH